MLPPDFSNQPTNYLILESSLFGNIRMYIVFYNHNESFMKKGNESIPVIMHKGRWYMSEDFCRHHLGSVSVLLGLNLFANVNFYDLYNLMI